MSATTDETSVYCVHAVVYESAPVGTRDWKPLGNADWAEMHIFKVRPSLSLRRCTLCRL